MEKGILTKATQDQILKAVQEWTKDSKPWLKLVITLGVKATFVVADDKYADQLPEEVKDKAQQFFDAILVTKDINQAILLGVELIPIVIELLKKDDNEDIQ